MHWILKNKYFYIGLILTATIAIAITIGIHIFKQPVKNPTNAIIDEQITLKEHEVIRVVHANKVEKGLIIYIASSGNINGDTAYAKKFAELSYYVAVINSQDLLKKSASATSACLNIAEKINELAKKLQDYYDLDNDELPILAGADEGATLVYSILAQTNDHKFHAGVSINFSLQLNSNTPLCKQQGINDNANTEFTLPHAKHLPTSWYVFQDKNAINNMANAEFINKIGNAKLKIPSGPEQTPLSEAIQILQWLDPRLSDQTLSDNSQGELPLIEVPSENNSAKNSSQSMAIIFTGDGGWAEIDKSIAKILSEKGVPTLGVDSLSYFWKLRTPEETAKSLEDTIVEYMEKWQKKNVILIGYSFGADVLPFIANKLSTETQKHIALVAMLGLGKTAAFEFHLSSWMNADTDQNRRPIPPELKRMAWANSICIYGVDDPESNCAAMTEFGVKAIPMHGDHHFNKEYETLVQHLLTNTLTDRP